MPAGHPEPEAPEIPIRFRDDRIVVVAKPSGLLVHRSREARDRVVLVQSLRRRLAQRVYPVQRLDRATSGLMALALASEDARWLQEELAHGTKDYLALVRGDPPGAFVVDDPLRDDKGRIREAATDFVTVERFGYCALLRARPLTGRRHQIRRHLNHRGHQILGDTSYGKGRLNRLYREKYRLNRLFLHCARLCFRHAPRGEVLEFVEPLPRDLLGVLEQLRSERRLR